MIFAACFTNFGPYHLARLRALAIQLRERGDCLVAYEMAGSEKTYPWQPVRHAEPFDWITLFPDRALETLTPAECATAIVRLLDQRPARRCCHHRLRQARVDGRGSMGPRNRRVAILMSESQAIDRPRAWWKEMIKRRRLRCLMRRSWVALATAITWSSLGMPADRITLGYNAVDNAFYREQADCWQRSSRGTARAAGGAVLPERLPVRPREKPAQADQGLRSLPRPGKPGCRMGPCSLRRRSPGWRD